MTGTEFVRQLAARLYVAKRTAQGWEEFSATGATYGNVCRETAKEAVNEAEFLNEELNSRGLFGEGVNP